MPCNLVPLPISTYLPSHTPLGSLPVPCSDCGVPTTYLPTFPTCLCPYHAYHYTWFFVFFLPSCPLDTPCLALPACRRLFGRLWEDLHCPLQCLVTLGLFIVASSYGLDMLYLCVVFSHAYPFPGLCHHLPNSQSVCLFYLYSPFFFPFPHPQPCLYSFQRPVPCRGKEKLILFILAFMVGIPFLYR